MTILFNVKIETTENIFTVSTDYYKINEKNTSIVRSITTKLVSINIRKFNNNFKKTTTKISIYL